jgi:hypothetical protein
MMDLYSRILGFLYNSNNLDNFPKYHTKTMLGHFNAKVGILKLITGNESLHKISNNNGVRVVNFAT